MGARLNTALDAISAAMKYLDAPPRASKDLTDAAKRARAFLGTTDDPREAGYILPSGELLNLSGKGRDISDFPKTARQFESMSFGFEPGSRNLPHAVTEDILDMDMTQFLDASGATRFDPSEFAIEAARVPTGVQRYRAADIAAGERLAIDAVDPETRALLGYTSIESPSPNQLKGFYEKTIGRRGLKREPQELLRALDQIDQGYDVGPSLSRYVDQLGPDPDPLSLLLDRP